MTDAELRRVARAFVAELADGNGQELAVRVVVGSPFPGRVALRVEEAAASLGLSRDAFDAYVKPELRLVRRGRVVLVPVRELERWLERSAALTLDLRRVTPRRWPASTTSTRSPGVDGGRAVEFPGAQDGYGLGGKGANSDGRRGQGLSIRRTTRVAGLGRREPNGTAKRSGERRGDPEGRSGRRRAPHPPPGCPKPGSEPVPERSREGEP